LTVYLDQPTTSFLNAETFRFVGWIAVPFGRSRRFAFETTSGPLRAVTAERPDVSAAYPEHDVVGFQADVNIFAFLPAIADGFLTIFLVSGANVEGYFRFQIAEEIMNRVIQHSAAY
jgi:hypothetical protein